MLFVNGLKQLAILVGHLAFASHWIFIRTKRWPRWLFLLWKIDLIFTQTKVNFEISFAFRDQVCYTVNSWKWKISTRLDYSVEFSGLCVLELWLSGQKLLMLWLDCPSSIAENQNYEDNIFIVTFFVCLFLLGWFKAAKLSNGAMMPLIGLG